MSLAIIAPGKDRKPWVDAISLLDPGLEVQVYPEIDDPGSIRGAILWKYPYGILEEFPNLEWVTSLGAGVDYILNDPKLPVNLQITRIVDPHLARDMKRSATLAILNIENRIREYGDQQRAATWKPLQRRNIKTIGIMGMGEMGRSIAGSLIQLDYTVLGLSRQGKPVEGMEIFPLGSLYGEFAQRSDLILSVLPLTEENRGILNAKLFDKMKEDSWLVNLGRGAHLNERDLLKALEEGRLGGAWLDVFEQEPLPEGHPFWKCDEIVITPHIASVTDPYSASKVVVENYRRLIAGKELLYLVDRDRGY